MSSMHQVVQKLPALNPSWFLQGNSSILLDTVPNKEGIPFTLLRQNEADPHGPGKNSPTGSALEGGGAGGDHRPSLGGMTGFLNKRSLQLGTKPGGLELGPGAFLRTHAR